MAYTKDDFLTDLAIYSTGAVVGIKNTGKFFAYAGRKGINLGFTGARRAAPSVTRGIGSLIRRNPAIFAGLTIAEAYRMGLLDEPIEQTQEFVTGGIEQLEEAAKERVRPKRKKKSKFNNAVSAGMAAVRRSKSFGKAGKINNAKRAFSAVTKVASKVNRGKKVSAKGVSGTIARAVRRILK
jgi:hypothetical protein